MGLGSYDLCHYDKRLEQAFEQLFIDVFSASEGAEEGLSIGRLVHDLLTETDGADIIGFVAREHDKVIGGIIFSRVTFENSDKSAFILSPVAIHMDRQKQGLGQALISHGLDSLKSMGVDLVFTYGDPNYYAQVGFQQIAEELIKAPQKMSMPHGWLCQSLTEKEIAPITGQSYCVSALNQPSYW